MRVGIDSRRTWKSHAISAIRLLVAAALLCVGMASFAADIAYPQRPIRLIVPFPPGGSGDFIGRIVADNMARDLGQQVVVEYKAGAASMVGSDYVAKASPDGYTILLGVSNMAINASLYDKMAFDPIGDLEPITLIGTVPNIIVANASAPVDDLTGLIQLAKKKPDFVTYGSAGKGSGGHIAAVRLQLATQTQMLHVPYKGAAPATVDLLGGRIMLVFGNVPTVLQHIKSGRLKALAVTGARRSPALPDVPTVAEGGIDGYENSAWYGLFAPAKTPSAIINRLNAAAQKFLTLSDVRERLLAEDVFLETPGATPGDFAKRFRKDLEDYAVLLKKAKVD